jgi:hypothetical protein
MHLPAHESSTLRRSRRRFLGSLGATAGALALAVAVPIAYGAAAVLALAGAAVAGRLRARRHTVAAPAMTASEVSGDTIASPFASS